MSTMDIFQLGALVVPPLMAVFMLILQLKIKAAFAELRAELIEKVTVVHDKVLQHEERNGATQRWIDWVDREIHKLQEQQNELAQSLSRCQAFHQEGRNQA